MILQSKYIEDKNGVKYAPITVPQAVRWSNGDDLDDKLSEKANKVDNPTSGNFAALDANGNIVDSGHKHSDYLTQHQSLADYIQKSSTSGLVKNDGTIDTNTYLTQHQDISGKEDITTIVAPINQTDATLPITTLTTEIGKYYRIDVPIETLGVTLPAMGVVTSVKTITIYLTGGTTPAVTITSADSKDVYYQDGYEIKAGKTYEVSCLYNGAAWIIASVEIVIPTNEGE